MNLAKELMGLRDSVTAKALFWVLPIVLFIGVLAMPREEYVGDPMAVRGETISLINTGSLEVPPQLSWDKGQYFFENPITHKYYSKWGILNDAMSLPPLLAELTWNGTLPYRSANRMVFLNFYNVFLSLFSATYLCLIVARYTGSALVVVLFVLSAFYCTYWWNYLRAHNSEIYQSLFMLAFYYHATAHFDPRSPGNRHLFRAGIFLSLLILVKTVYVILIPMAFVWMAVLELLRSELFLKDSLGTMGKALLRTLIPLIVPVTCAVLILLAVDAYKFGSPFETGFAQWGQDKKPLFSGSIFHGMYLMLFNLQGSVFLYFPLLVFALAGYRRFFRDHPADVLLFSTSALLLFLINAKLLNPLGIWCLGPRYMLVVLPLMSLPFISTLELLLGHLRKAWAIASLSVITLVFAYSFHLQMNVNALPFFTYYEVQAFFTNARNTAVDTYFENRPPGLIAGDILAWKHGAPYPPLEIVAPKLSPAGLAAVKESMRTLTPSNYYWWP